MTSKTKKVPARKTKARNKSPAVKYISIVFKAKDRNQFGPANMEDALDELLRSLGQGWVDGAGFEVATGDQDLGVVNTAAEHLDTVVTLIQFLRELEVGKNTVITVPEKNEQWPVWKEYK